LRRRFAFLATGTTAALLAASSPAFAQLVADPSGGTTGTCEPPDPPCSLQHAVEVEAQDGEEVIVTPGTYAEGTNQVTISDAISVHGADGQEVPTISFDALGGGVFLDNPASSLRRVRVEYTSPNAGLIVEGTVEQVVVDATDAACELHDGALIRDSICWTHGATNEVALGLPQSSPVTESATVRNVTAVGTGTGVAGIGTSAFGGANTTIDARNVIADGTLADVNAFASGAGSMATVNLSNSNYATQLETPLSGGLPSVTDPGTGTNQTAAPLFDDATAGDFHQLPGSPTIDAGDPSATLLGTLDFEAEPRVADGDGICPIAPDIGADEFAPPNQPPECPPPPGPGPGPAPEPEPQPTSQDTDPPETTITKAPPDKGEKNKVKYKFVADEPSTFECKADKGEFEPCGSPEKLKVDDGKHKFQVVATDLAENRDPTPGKDKFKVVD
jgi:hypothetical protein